ncbi:hypothetical protein [Enterococcus rotai]|uniref:hypothetical protein n=1 Tax=Enterococcus rotai TaxID=118060 RepID=UPI0032B5131F
MESRKIWLRVSLTVFLGMIIFPYSSQAEVIWPNWDNNVKTGWEEIKSPEGRDTELRVYDPNKYVYIGPSKSKANVTTGLYPGGSQRAAFFPDKEDYLLRRRTDVPFIEFYPKSTGVSLNAPHKKASLGRDVDIGRQGAVRPVWNLNLKSLGLVFAVDGDLSTIQEASTGKITDYELSPEEPTIDVSTFKLYEKQVSRVNIVNGLTMTAVKYVYEVNLKNKQGESYRVQVDNTYYPSKDGRIRVSFDIKNIGKKTIPNLMVGYNFTPEVKFVNVKINNEPDGLGVAGKVKYLGKNLGVYAVDSDGMYRAEIYPSLDKYGANSWTAWCEPFVGEFGMGNRDSSVFMKGFDDPNDINSKGQENKGIPKDTVLLDEPVNNREGGTDTTISMKWNPQDLAVGETRNTAWIYGSEIKDIYPLLNVSDDGRKYSVSEGGKPNAVVRGTWRIYETLNGTIKYTVDDGKEQTLDLEYANEEDIGGVETFEIPLTFEPTAEHTVKLQIEDAAGHKSEEITEVYSFEYPDPEIKGSSSIKVNNKETDKLMIGREFDFSMDLAMQTPYSRLFGNKVSIPIDTTVIDVASLKNISITNGTKVVKGTFNSSEKSLDFTFEDEVVAGDKLQLQFTGKIIDSVSLVGRNVEIIPSQVAGKSGSLTDFKEFIMPADKLPKATATIVPNVSKINIKYLIEGSTTSLGELEPPREGLNGSTDTIPSKTFNGYLLSKIVVDGVEQKPLSDPVPVEYGTTNEVVFYYQVKPVLTADLAISLSEISEGEKVVYTSTFKNTSVTPSDLNDVMYDTIEAFPENVNVNLESMTLNGQPLAKGIATVDANRKLSVNLGELAPEVEYTLTYEVVSKSATPPITKPLEVKQAYTIKGKSVNGTLVKAESDIKTFKVKPRIAPVEVLYLEAGSDEVLHPKLSLSGQIGQPTEQLQLEAIEGYELTQVFFDDQEQLPLPDKPFTVNYGAVKQVKFYYEGGLRFKAVPDAFDFGTHAGSVDAKRFKPQMEGQKLIVSDTRRGKSGWTLKAKITEPLKNAEGEVMTDVIKYNNGSKEELTLNGADITIFQHKESAKHEYDITKENWQKNDEGFLLDIKAGGLKSLGKYQGKLQITLEDAK